MNINKKLLAEELKKHKRLLEYSFYVDEDDDIDVLGKGDDGKGLILQADPETDQEVDPNAAPEDANADPNADPNAEGGENIDVEVGGETDAGAEGGDDAGFGGDEEDGGDIGFGADEMGVDEPVEAPAEDEVDVDVTALVQGTEEAKQMAQMNGQKMEQLLQQFNQLASQLGKMDSMTKKIDDLEQEVVKRNPTPVEKLEMRSLDSYPYNLKLTDFWAEKDGNYDAMGKGLGAVNPNEKKDKEYVLTQDDVSSDFSHGAVKKSFDEYEEEDI